MAQAVSKRTIYADTKVKVDELKSLVIIIMNFDLNGSWSVWACDEG